jgi:hypothetical protein
LVPAPVIEDTSNTFSFASPLLIPVLLIVAFIPATNTTDSLLNFSDHVIVAYIATSCKRFYIDLRAEAVSA